MGKSNFIDIAGRASEEYSKAAEEELKILNSLPDFNREDNDNTKPKVSTRSLKFENIEKDKTYDDIIIATDNEGNKIVIPNNFKVVSGNEQNIKDGVVIEDNYGNQYVWVPVNQKINDTTIKLERSNFGGQTYEKDDCIDEFYYGEEYSDSCIKNTDYDIKNFKGSVKKYGGFYIGRYETSSEILREEETEEFTIPMIKASDNYFSYNNVTRNEAMALSQKVKDVYQYNSVTTALCNSYAWDTALKFINISTNSNISSEEKKYGNTECPVANLDACNIYDMFSNHNEWTTEFSNSELYNCVARGGYFSFDYSGKYRSCYAESFKSSCVGFRVIMYLD